MSTHEKRFFHNLKGSRKLYAFTLILAVITLILIVVLYCIGYTVGFPGSYPVNRSSKQGLMGEEGDPGERGPQGPDGPPGLYAEEDVPFSLYESGTTDPIFYKSEKTGLEFYFRTPFPVDYENVPIFLFQIFNKYHSSERASWIGHLLNYVLDEEKKNIVGLKLVIQRNDGKSEWDMNLDSKINLPFLHYFVFQSSKGNHILTSLQNSKFKMNMENPISSLVFQGFRRLSEIILQPN